MVYINTAEPEITKNSNGILSIKMQTDWFAGGVYNTNFYGLNYNLKAGTTLSLMDVFSLSESDILRYIKNKTIDIVTKETIKDKMTIFFLFTRSPLVLIIFYYLKIVKSSIIKITSFM